MIRKIVYIPIIAMLLISCRKKEEVDAPIYNPTPYQIDLPQNFPPMDIPADNPLTEEGIKLGRYLFWDNTLSGDNSMACASCHIPQYGFADPSPTSTGIGGIAGTRNAMVLQNLGWADSFFWDGRAATLEDLAILPVIDTIEMHEKWSNFFAEVKGNEFYDGLFYEAFGTLNYDSTHAAKAIAQFLRTMVSYNSKFDRVMRGEENFTPQEQAGFDSFNSLSGGDCFHCHGGILATDNSFANNGLDAMPDDTAHGMVTNDPNDNFKFKIPSLRNLAYTAPYMHDGRFQTIDEVINFYSVGLEETSPNISPLMEFANQGGVQLDPQERAELKAFLLTLTDESFINNPDFQNPW